MWIKKRHKVTTEILRFIFFFYFKFRYNLHHDKPIKIKDGALIISNHTTTLDPIMIGSLFKDPLYYMASKDIFNHRFIGKLIKFLVNPIGKEKGNSSDITAVKDCIRVAKEGGNICIFAEGNRTFNGSLGNVDFSIVKLAKLLKKPLVICNIKGGYPTDPRWARTIRKGRMDVSIKHIYKYDEFKDMENDDLYNLIHSDMTVDDYNFYPKYKGRHQAEHLEKILSICPCCKSKHTIYTRKNKIYCSVCNLEVTYLNNLKFKSNKEEFKLNNVKEWYDYQLDVIKKEQHLQEDEVIYQDEIDVYLPRMYKKKKKIGSGLVQIYNNRFVFKLKKEIITILFSNIKSITLVGKMKMNIYTNDITYQLFKDDKTNLIKYMHLYYIIKGSENYGI